MILFRKNAFLILLGFTLLISACSPKTVAQVQEEIPTNTVKKKDTSTMSFDQRVIDIGVVKKGEKKEVEYTFTNTGTEDIAISQVSTCDCTEVLKRPYLPVKPGETGTIKVLFDSNKKDEVEPVEIDIWLEKEDPNTGMPVLERIEYIFKFES